MPTTTTRPSADAWIDEAKPAANRPRTPRLRLRSSDTSVGKRTFVFAALPFFQGSGAHVVSATLRVFAANDWSGTQTITAKRVTQRWAENRVTWNNQPAVSGTNAAQKIVTDAAEDDEIEIDLTAMVADVAAGQIWFGLRLELDSDSDRHLHSANSPTARLRPKLEVVWRADLEAPTPLAPIGGQSVSVASPTLTWRVEADEEFEQSASQVQISTSEDFASPAYDSGKQANVEGQWDLTGLYSLAEDDVRYWRVRVWDDVDQESEWSEAHEFRRDDKGELTIVNPPITVAGYKALVAEIGGSDLAAYWALDDTDGASDLSGNGHDGTALGGVTVGGDASDPLGVGGTSTAFDGADDAIDTPYVLDDGASITLCGFAWRDESGEAKLWVGGGANWAAFLVNADGDMQLFADAGAIALTFDSAWPGNGAWVAWALVFDADLAEVTLYIDGEAVSQQPFAGWGGSPPTLRISEVDGSGLEGKQGHVSVIERALSAEEVRRLSVPDIEQGGAAGAVEDTNPPIVWELTGATQEQYRVELERYLPDGYVPWRTEWETGWVTSPDTSVQVPRRHHLRSGRTYRARVSVRDDQDRAATPGDRPAYVAERVFTYQRAGGLAPVETLSATADGPKVTLEWTRTETPDEFALRLDGEEVIVEIDPEEVRVDATTYRLDVWLAQPGVQHTYEVEAVVHSETLSWIVSEHSGGNATAQLATHPQAAWLVDTDDETLVTIYQSDGRSSSLEVALHEISEVHEVLSGDLVQITDAIGGVRGSVAGELHSAEHRANLEELRERDKTLRLIAGDLNIPVRIRSVTAPIANVPGNSVWDVSFEFFEVVS